MRKPKKLSDAGKIKLAISVLEELIGPKGPLRDAGEHEYCHACGGSPYWYPPHKADCRLVQIAECLKRLKK